MAGEKQFRIRNPIDFITTLIVVILGPRGCTILFFLASLLFFLLDLIQGLYLSERFFMAVGFFIILFFGLFGNKDTSKKRIVRISMIAFGVLILALNIYVASSAEVKYGSSNMIPCLIAEHKLAEQPEKAFLIEKKGGKDRYLAKGSLSQAEIEKMVEETVGSSVNIEYRKLFNSYTLRRNGKIIGTIQPAPCKAFYNVDLI